MNIAVIFGALSAYHVARLESAGRLLDESGHEITLIERVGRQHDYPWFGGLSSTKVIIRKAYDTEDYSPDTRTSAAQLWKLLEELQPEVVAFGLSAPAYIAVVEWCIKRHRPAVMFFASLDYGERSNWKEKVKKRIYSLFSAALVGGSTHQEYITKLGLPKDHVYFGYNAVNNNHFWERSSEARNNAYVLRCKLRLQQKYFLTSCRLIAEKNLERLITAYARYVDSCQCEVWQLVLVGDGPLKGSLKSLRTKFGLQNDLLMMPGLISYNDIGNYYGLASAFLLPSVSETWGLVVNEAMASGLPVIVSKRCGCAQDLVEDGKNGFVIDPFNIDDMVEKMVQMTRLSDAARQAMGQRSREIIADWGPERFASGLKDAVNKALEIGARKVNALDRLLLKALILKR